MSLVVPLEDIFANKTKLLANHESWERVELRKVSTILNGFPFKSTLFNKSEGFPVIRIRDIARSSTDTFYSGDFPREYVVKKGDLLIGMDGNFRCCEWQGRDAGLNQRVCKITPDERILHRKFLFYGLNGYLKAIEDVTSSVTVGHLSSRDVQRIPFPLPPLGEQRRIVAKLETLLGKVDASQQRLAKIPVLLKRFRQSVLAAACSGRLTADWREESDDEAEAGESVQVPDDFPLLPDPWRWQPLEFVCENIADCPHSTPKWSDAGRLCARTTNFKLGFLDLSEVRYVSDTTFNERIERLRPKPGDVLYSREGGILGIACMIPPKIELCLGQRMMLFRTKSDFTAALLMHWLNSPVILRRVHELTGGSASPHLNVRDIKAFPTPVPPLPEQQEIVRRVEGLFALADEIEARFTQARAQVDQLKPSLLARAFAGQLVPQDSNDEPASNLLNRIRQAKAVPESTKLHKTGTKGRR